MLAICLVLMGTTPSGKAQAPTNQIQSEIRIMDGNTIIPNYSNPQEQLPIDKLLDYLGYCESGNRSDIIVWDNGSYSYGQFMFKEATLKAYSIKYGYLPDNLEAADYVNWALDSQYARKLAKTIIEQGGWPNWYHCLKGYKSDILRAK